jgi:hypothetical protein
VTPNGPSRNEPDKTVQITIHGDAMSSTFAEPAKKTLAAYQIEEKRQETARPIQFPGSINLT